MTMDLLARLTVGGEAIPRLRKAVLDLAVRGHLVEQLSTDAPAIDAVRKARTPELLGRRGGKLGTAFPSSTEVPFSIPANWCWCRLDQVGLIVGGGTPPSADSANFVKGGTGIPWLTPADLGKTKAEYVSHGARDITQRGLAASSATVMPKGTVLFTSRAPIGYVAIASREVSTNQGFKSLVPSSSIISEYAAVYFRAFTADIAAGAPGTTFKEVSGKLVAALVVPVPPLEEQHRIVSKVRHLMDVCEELQTLQGNCDETRDRLRAASLARLAAPMELPGRVAHKDVGFFLSHSDRMVTKPEHVADLRQSVLDLVVLGRLPTSNPEEVSVAPAMEGLDLPDGYVRRRKIVRRRPSSPGIDVPHPNWVIRTVQDLYDCNAVIDFADGNHGALYPRASEFSDAGVLFVTAKDLHRGRVVWESCAHLSEERAARLMKGWSEGGDVLLTHNATVGRVARVEAAVPRFLLGTSVTYYRLHPSAIAADYFYYYLQSSTWQRQMTAIMEQTTRNQVSIQKQADFWVLLPPLLEQHRIVSRIDALMTVCDELEHALRVAEEGRAKLLEAVLREALTDRAGVGEATA